MTSDVTVTGGNNHSYFNAICDIEILCAFLLVSPCVYVKATLMVLYCMIMLNTVCAIIGKS